MESHLDNHIWQVDQTARSLVVNSTTEDKAPEKLFFELLELNDMSTGTHQITRQKAVVAGHERHVLLLHVKDNAKIVDRIEAEKVVVLNNLLTQMEQANLSPVIYLQQRLPQTYLN